MITEVVSVRADATCRDAALKLSEGGFGSLPVVDSENKLVGLISEYDILENLFKDQLTGEIPVSEVMVHEVKTVKPDTPVDTIRRILQMGHLIRVPVVKDEKLVGIIARRDLIKGYINATSGAGG
ncbi:MAG TPA: CBS domain-containing protein [Nitrospiria bacterium]